MGRRLRIFVLALVALSILATAGLSAGSGSHPGKHERPHRTTAGSYHPRRWRARCLSCAHDSNGRIRRSLEAKHAFRRAHPCPSTGKTYGPCPGYVIDHVVPLKRGGADAQYNMQWQTVQAAKAKDKIE